MSLVSIRDADPLALEQLLVEAARIADELVSIRDADPLALERRRWQGQQLGRRVSIRDADPLALEQRNIARAVTIRLYVSIRDADPLALERFAPQCNPFVLRRFQSAMRIP